MSHILDSTYTFSLEYPLPQQLVDHVYTLPGFSYSRGYSPALTAPYNAAWLAVKLLDSYGLCYSVTPPPMALPRDWSGMAENALDAMILGSSCRDWLVTGVDGPWKLLPFQKEALWWMLEHGGGFLQEAPGAGKTVQSAVFADCGPPGPCLFISKNTVTEQFRRAIEQFIDTEAIELVAASKQGFVGGAKLTVQAVLDAYLQENSRYWRGKLQPMHVSRHCVVVGWGSLQFVIDDLLRIPWQTVVFDESHHGGKAPKREEWSKDINDRWTGTLLGNTTAAAWQLAKRTPRRLAMTATPIPDRRRDLWGQLTLAEPDRSWGRTWGRFVRRYCDARPGEFGGLDTAGTSNTEELEKRLSMCLHTVPKAVSHAQLPPMRIYTHYVPQSRQDKPATGFKRKMSSAAKRVGKGEVEARNELAELGLMEAATRKRTATLELLDEHLGARGGRGKCIVFSGRHRDTFDLAERCRKKFASKGVHVWCGVERVSKTEEALAEGKAGTYRLPNKTDRQAIHDAYMEHPGPCLLVATGQAWGTGLDLHDSDLLLIVMLPWSPGDLVQWMHRVHRLGMNRPVQVIVMVAQGTADEKAALKLAEKTPDIVRVGKQSEMTGVRDSMLGLDDAEGLLDSVLDKRLRPDVIELQEDAWDGM